MLDSTKVVPCHQFYLIFIDTISWEHIRSPRRSSLAAHLKTNANYALATTAAPPLLFTEHFKSLTSTPASICSLCLPIGEGIIVTLYFPPCWPWCCLLGSDEVFIFYIHIIIHSTSFFSLDVTILHVFLFFLLSCCAKKNAGNLNIKKGFYTTITAGKVDVSIKDKSNKVQWEKNRETSKSQCPWSIRLKNRNRKTHGSLWTNEETVTFISSCLNCFCKFELWLELVQWHNLIVSSSFAANHNPTLKLSVL